jgi:competence protein ComEC
VQALRGWRDVTRDAAHEPRAAQFRIDLRSLGQWISAHMPERLGKAMGTAFVGGLSLTFRVWELLVVTMALQIGMLPLMARDFHRVALAAPIVNLGAVPMVGVLVPLGFATLTMSLLFPAAGKLLAAPLVWATMLMMHLVHWFAHFPRWSYRIPGPPFWLIALFFVVGIVLGTEMRLRHSRQRAFAWAFSITWVTFALTIAMFPFPPKWSKGKLEVSVLDVGQGDSIFVVSPGGKTLLIDGGGAFGGFQGQEQNFGIDPGEEAVSPYLWSRGFQKLDVVALTHAHQDHLGGLAAILENFRVGKLWIGREVSSLGFHHLEEVARERKIPIERELRGKSFDWDGVSAEFLWPEIGPGEVALAAKNDDSLVLRLRFGDRNILLPGDAEKLAEHKILEENSADLLHSEILKVGHHGSKNSTIPEFLAAVRPQIGIISVGEANPYGHPSPELLERLQGAGVRILRTDRDGAVHVLTDGQRFEISCFVGCPAAAETTASGHTETPNRKETSEN